MFDVKELPVRNNTLLFFFFILLPPPPPPHNVPLTAPQFVTLTKRINWEGTLTVYLRAPLDLRSEFSVFRSFSTTCHTSCNLKCRHACSIQSQTAGLAQFFSDWMLISRGWLCFFPDVVQKKCGAHITNIGVAFSGHARGSSDIGQYSFLNRNTKT
jgi:hypothetical protein